MTRTTMTGVITSAPWAIDATFIQKLAHQGKLELVVCAQTVQTTM